jgi:hypothetical protein
MPIAAKPIEALQAMQSETVADPGIMAVEQEMHILPMTTLFAGHKQMALLESH